MVFSSILFLFYFLPAFLLVYYLAPVKLKNAVILIASVFFYSWGAPEFIFIVLISVVLDFYFIRYLPEQSPVNRKLLISLSLLLNVGLLAYFKYANFFIDNVNQLLHTFGSGDIVWTRIALPIGISFFTFQKISYAVDIYRGVKSPVKSLVNYALYILMFPQLIAGPIVRYHEIADQIKDRRHNENTANRINGLFRFAIGLTKKVLIANVLGEQVDLIFNLSGNDLNSSLAWLGILAYSFQIYFDFSGYSDMAIGLGRMMGFHFPENFNFPYISRNITEFWRRWHITLGNWMKEYLYIPLGGNRVLTKRRLYFNLWVVFLISGLWHGASWNFVIWGIFHGFFIIIDRLFYKKVSNRISRFIAVPICYLLVLIGWVFFRSETLGDSIFFLEKMFVFDFQPAVFYDYKFIVILIVAAIFSFSGMLNRFEKFSERILAINQNKIVIISVYLISILMIFLCTSSLVASGFNPFIYFRF